MISEPRLAADPLRAADRAAPPSTLVDIFAGTAARHPRALAIDDGAAALTYAALADAVRLQADRLAAVGIRRGDRVGVRVRSGTTDLYLAILAILHAGAAYVPVDAEDPDERARQAFSDADVVAVVGDGLTITHPDGRPAAVAPDTGVAEPPGPQDDAWIIFTSGSTGRPKGVAVTHRSAAALVDAEAGLFLRDAPIGPGDRVLAGLSVAFDASCEEMWLAWRHGATLVPAPRALVRAGIELGPWILERGITVVSTVPTLAATWSADCLDGVRLLIFGGEAVPAELAARLWRPGRELWNTYGPTETTVIACAALLVPGEPVRIGVALDGWDLAVVDPDDREVGEGQIGELVIAGVGVARYLDADLDAAKFRPLGSLGWERAYRTGDLVRVDRAGLVFVGRTDDQVKVCGRRIELGEIDAALQALSGIAAAAAAVRHTSSGTALLVGYLVPSGPGTLDTTALVAALRGALPASMVPLLAVVTEIPTLTSGKVDRAALPWPLNLDAGGVPSAPTSSPESGPTGTAAWIGQQWAAVIGVRPTDDGDDFFSHGGSSLSAAHLVSALRARYPDVTVGDVYEHPTLGRLAAHLSSCRQAPREGSAVPGDARRSAVRRIPVRSQVAQLLALVPLRTLVALRWLTALAALNNLLDAAWRVPWAVPVSWWWVAAGWVLTVSPLGRMGVSALGARVLLAGLTPGTYPRGGSVHLRLWAAERLAEGFGAVTPASAPWIRLYARALGAKVGRDVDLHTVPPVTGMLTLGRGCAVEPEVDLSGYWVEGDLVHVGPVRIGARASVGARSVLYPGADVGAGTEVAAGSAVHGRTGEDERWAGSPARRAYGARHPWPAKRPAGRATSAWWAGAYAMSGALVATLPVVAVATALVGMGWAVRDATTLGGALGSLLAAGLVASAAAFACYALLVVVVTRWLGRGLAEGCHPVRSGVGLRAWSVQRLTDAARTALFPLYSSVVTPAWLRLLGARVGRGTEISTVVGLPSMMRVKDGAFLADDTMLAPYELGGGWLRVASAKVGRRGFLGNSGMTAPGRTVPKNGLVAVLAATPRQTRAGSAYLGSPAVPLPRTAVAADPTRTYEPPRRLRWGRGAVEALRVVPAAVVALLALGTALALQALVVAGGWGLATALSGVVLLAAGVVAAVVTVAAKWMLVGRYRPGEHPLWSLAVWRGELADTFTEMVAAPFFANAASGTVALVWWLRGMGARIGRGVWCQTYWLPEADLVRIGDAATVGPGCVVQTHLFHDRVMSLAEVTLDDGATLGPHGVVLPAARVGADAIVGPASLVLRGEQVPPGSRWTGNPIARWHPERSAA